MVFGVSKLALNQAACQSPSRSLHGVCSCSFNHALKNNARSKVLHARLYESLYARLPSVGLFVTGSDARGIHWKTCALPKL